MSPREQDDGSNWDKEITERCNRKSFTIIIRKIYKAEVEAVRGKGTMKVKWTGVEQNVRGHKLDVLDSHL